ncbi:MAG: hypothetical protein HY245_03935 [Rhizobiales bacterium]|nr:hypothetical protein [Hyphomicrobiales bacterium]MBI3672572.1 hypothetical protein [Hyphomicrobiales bacterium]
MGKKRPGNSHGARKFAWLDQVAADHELSRLALHVAYALARWITPGGKGWRSQKLLAADCGISFTAARNAIDSLARRGHLMVVTGNGRGHATTYSWVMKVPEKCNADGTFEENKVPPTLHLSKNKGATKLKERCHGDPHKGAMPVAPNPLSKSVEDSVESISPKKPLSNGMAGKAFDEFWFHYPRKVAKGAAEKAYVKALKATDAATLLAGAKRYAAEQQGKDPKYTKHPAGWLNEKRWEDEPVSPYGGGNGSGLAAELEAQRRQLKTPPQFDLDIEAETTDG